MPIPYITQPTWIDSVSQIHSATDLNTMVRNAQWLDMVSFPNIPSFDYSHEEPDVVYQGSSNTKGDKRFWWGAGQLRTGMTTLTVVGTLTKYGSETLQIFLNGSGTASATISSNGAFTQTITLPAFTDGDILTVEVKKIGSSAGYGIYRIDDAYLTPLPTLPTSWPGVPTFASTYNQTLLNQLTAAADWLLARINQVPLIPHVGQIEVLASYKPHPSVAAEPFDYFPVYQGSVLRLHSTDRLRVVAQVRNRNNPSEALDVYVNGSIAATATISPGVTIHSFPITLSHTVGTRVPVSIRQRVITGNERPGPQINTRIWLVRCTTEPNASGHAYSSAPSLYTGNVAISNTTHNTKLNAIASTLSAVKARIDARPEYWSRVRLMRRRYAIDEPEYNKGKNISRHPMCFDTRRGDRLVVRGKDVKLCWGPQIVKNNEETGEPNYEDVSFTHEEQIIDADKIDTKTVYLDAYDSLYPSTVYYVKGADVVYAAEYYV